MPRPAYRGARRYQAPKRLSSPKHRRISSPTEAYSHLESKTRHKPVGQRPLDSDDSDELVKKVRRPQSRNSREIYASGGVGKGDTPGSHPTKAQRTRTMRKETEEIIRSRSSSASRPSSPEKRSSGDDLATKKRPPPPTSQPALSPKPPQNEGSILGAFKPRKRQPSILQRMSDDSNQSSLINSDDEEQFLPDAISTPIADFKNTNNVARAELSTASKKRKRGSEMIEQTSVTLPQASRTQTKKLAESLHKAQDNSIMALPASSDSEDDNRVANKLDTRELKTRGSAASRKPPNTGRLQSLMPSKRHRPKQSGRHQDEFDILDDSSSAHAETKLNEQGKSTSRAARRTVGHSRAGGSKALAASSRSTKTGKPESTAKTRNKVKEKDKKAKKSLAPASVRMDSPLPLSSSRSGNVQAKSSSSKQGDTSCDINTRRPPATSKGRQYGGSHRTLSDKENDLHYTHGGSNGDKDRLTRSASAINDETKTLGPEARAWSSKWADIDDYSLEFEEVTRPRSSSPLAR